MSDKPDRQLTRAIHRYSDAYASYVFEGSIPYHSADPDEQRALDEAHAAIHYELQHAEKLLRSLIQRRIDEAVAEATRIVVWEAHSSNGCHSHTVHVPGHWSEEDVLNHVAIVWAHGRTACGIYRDPGLKVHLVKE